MPDSRQSLAAEMVLAESALSSDVQSAAICVSHAFGSLHLVLDDFATPQKLPAASGAGSELHAPRTSTEVTTATAPIARATPRILTEYS